MWETWVPPSAIADMPAALDAITDRLDAGTIPVAASLLLAPVLDPERGVLDRLAVLLDAASRYAQQRGAAPEVWQDLGRAGQNLHEISQTLAGTTAALSELLTAEDSALGRGSPQVQSALPSPVAGPAPRRRH